MLGVLILFQAYRAEYAESDVGSEEGFGKISEANCPHPEEQFRLPGRDSVRNAVPVRVGTGGDRNFRSSAARGDTVLCSIDLGI